MLVNQKEGCVALNETITFLKKFTNSVPSVGVVLGTGLSALVEHMVITHTIPYNTIPNFPVSTVEFHKGHLLIGRIGETNVIAMQGRFHYYEGYTMQEITFPIRVLKELGCTHLLLSNAAGGINPEFKKGNLVLLDDHINLQTDNPLRGVNDPVFGQRFVDMCAPYDAFIGKQLTLAAVEQHQLLQRGVYASVIGPNLETRAEYRYLRIIGADLVGMSTVPEVIVANQIGLPCAAVSVITDECDPENLKPVNIADIIAIAGTADKHLSALFAATIQRLQGQFIS